MNLDNAVVLLKKDTKTVYRDGDTVIKVFEESFSKADILNEALNHARIEETNLNIPKLKGVNMIDGKWAIFTEYIEGKTLAELMSEDPSNFEKYLELFVDLHLIVHAQRQRLLNSLKIKTARKIDESDLNATIRYELQTRLQSMPKHHKVCHGDFNPSNIIVSDNGPYIFDWAHASQGNAAADAAITYLYFKLRREDEIAESYINLYCLKSDTAKQYIMKWIPIVAATQSLRSSGDEKNLLLSWADVVEWS